MPRKIKEYGRQDLMDVALPNHASTYTVISHKSVMDLSTKALEDAGFSVTAENYRATHDGNIASAIYTLNYGDDSELSMMFAWSNSYNKQMRFKCGVGAIHKTHNTSMVCGDMGSWARKHTGSADTETKETIEEQVKLAKMYYDQLVSDKEAMKKINLDVRKQSQLLGMLFAEHDVLTTEQASMIKQQMNKTTFNSSNPGSLWEFYNFVTIALQQSHPKTWMEDQRVLHWFMSDTFKFDKVEVKEEETIDPNQVDLEDSIAEVTAEQQEVWDQQTRVEEGLDHKGGEDDDDDEPVDDSPEITGIPDGDKLSDTDDEFDADAEMQEMKTEEIIKEKIAEDEAAVAEVCDEPEDIKIHVESETPKSKLEELEEKVEKLKSDEEYQKRVAEIEGEITDTEAEELIKGQEAIDQQMAQEAAADNSVSDENIDDVVEADFDMDFAVANSDEEEADDDVDFDFA